MTDAALLQHIMRLPHAKANLKQLMRETHAARETLEAALERLAVRGELIELRAGHYSATANSREFASGRVSMHRDGYGFLIPDKPVERVTGDIYIPPDSTLGAMHGDRALVRIARVEPSGRADGEILKILKRAHPTVVGEFRIARRGYFVVPQDERLQDWIEIPEEFVIPASMPQIDRIGPRPLVITDAAALEGMIVNAELVEYGERGEHPIGRIVEILGRPDDFGVDVEIVIRKHHLPNHFPSEVIEEVQNVPSIISAFELEGRRDFRHLPIVTIDGETARDFDDAVWIDQLPNGHFALHVHIADVSHYVRPGTPMDAEARLRGTSVYFPDRAVPMLPFELSTDISSLNPQVDRLVLSALM
ncbi:MAG: RNB domain-containing ribonuclease [Acidobacteriota bacterium]|nr:RNB domain-containing ribonuclease [Acidobacteriota bacterium]